MIANAKMEQMSRSDIKALQLERLKKTIAWVTEKSLFYQKKFKDAGIRPEDIQTLEDVGKLPFLTASELHQANAMDLLTLPLSGILRFNYMQDVSGELTKLYTNGDIANNVEMMTRCLVAAGIHNASIVGLQGELTDSRLLDIQYALEAIGAAVVPLGTGSKHWLRLLEIASIDTLISTPQLIMQLIIQLQAAGQNIVDYPISRIVCINLTNIQNPLQQHIQGRTKTKVYNLYASPELGTAGMLFQCEAHMGQHVQEDNFYAEIVAFNSDMPITEDNRMGELVVTTLTAEAMPLIRYRTGQAVSCMTDVCKCGRTFMRLATPFSYL